MVNDCIFCKIIAGELPSTKVYEDDRVLAILDINPVNPGHVLVMPREHYENIEAIPEDLLSAVAATVKKIGTALKNGLGVEGYNLAVNNDPISGQLIPHLHFHIIPRQAGDELKLWPGRQYEKPEEMSDIAGKIKTAL